MFSFSKTNLTVAMVILSTIAQCNAWQCSSKDSDTKSELAYSIVTNPDEANMTSDFELARTKKGRFAQLLGFAKGFNNWRWVGAILVGTMFVVGILALAMPGCSPDHGKHIFADEGASMWLRLTIGLSFLTFSIGVTTVAIHRACNSAGMNVQEYSLWKDTGAKDGYSNTKTTFRKENSSWKLQNIFFLALCVLAVFTLVVGRANLDNTMFYVAFGLPAFVGVTGLLWVNLTKTWSCAGPDTFKYFKNRTRDQQHRLVNCQKEIYELNRKIHELEKDNKRYGVALLESSDTETSSSFTYATVDEQRWQL